MRKILLFFLLALIIHSKNYAQDQLSASEILQQLKRLKVLGSVLYVAAHPDDENTRLLTYFNKEMNLRTGYLSITRGDGGQNLVGKEQAEILGMIRTQELLAARRIDEAEQFFTRANDFGYSKNPEETFRIWNKDTILADMVWVIRSFKPDIIVCRFPTTGEGGHGHHTASAILALEAFDAAADPSRFPEQLKFLQPWQVKRVFWNTFNFGTTNTTSPDQLKVDVGVFNPLTGKSVGEIAAESRSMHKSQGFGSAKTRGTSIEYFKQLKGDSASTSLFESVDLSWNRIHSNHISKMIDACIADFNTQKPENSVPGLIQLYQATKNLSGKDQNTEHWKNKKLKEIESLLVSCTGLWMEATADEYFGIPGNKIEITVQAINRSTTNITINRISWNNKNDTTTSLALKPNELNTFRHSEKLSSSLSFSDPYWLVHANENEGFFSVHDPEKTGKPENDTVYKVVFDLTIEGLNIKIERPLIHKSVDPIAGEKYRPFEILPVATVNFSANAFMFRNREARKIQLQIKSNADSLSGEVRVNVPGGWKVDPDIIYFGRMNKGDVVSLETTITPLVVNAAGEVSATIHTGNVQVSKSIYRVDHDHIPQQFMLTEAKAAINSLYVTLAGINIGYIPGAGDEVVESLLQLGYNVTLLTQDVLKKTDLSEFDAVITGIRAFNTNEWLQDFDEKLLTYIRDGGNLVVQYNTNNRIGPLTAKIFPYPFTISRTRVTDQTAHVTFAEPGHSVLNFPNEIDASDFEGWVQERGIYFASEIDSSYRKIFTMNDPGEKPTDGSLIVAGYGKGNFVYSGLAFFRQLPAGVPGAFRLFVNLLSIPGRK